MNAPLDASDWSCPSRPRSQNQGGERVGREGGGVTMKSDSAIALVVLGILTAVLAVPFCILFQRCRKDHFPPLFAWRHRNQIEADIRSTADALMLSVVTTLEGCQKGTRTERTPDTRSRGEGTTHRLTVPLRPSNSSQALAMAPATVDSPFGQRTSRSSPRSLSCRSTSRVP
jgi:hypothetical protein